VTALVAAGRRPGAHPMESWADPPQPPAESDVDTDMHAFDAVLRRQDAIIEVGWPWTCLVPA
jgi:hypothetical protein